MECDLVLLPNPRQLVLSDKSSVLPPDGLICIEAEPSQPLWLAARQLQESVNALPGMHWAVVGGSAVPAAQVRAMLSLVPGGVVHSQGYLLSLIHISEPTRPY